MRTGNVQFQTRQCPFCGRYGQVEVPVLGLMLWSQGELIQKAMPDVPDDIREQMITGTHPECWKKLFEEDPA